MLHGGRDDCPAPLPLQQPPSSLGAATASAVSRSADPLRTVAAFACDACSALHARSTTQQEAARQSTISLSQGLETRLMSI